MICLNVGGVGARIGVSNNVTPKRICLPYINVGSSIGDETPDIHPPDVLREAETGAPLLTPDGETLLVAGP